MAGRKRRLGRAIEDWAAKSHLSLAAMASQLGVRKPDTFRGWVNNNRFPLELLPRLGLLMGVEQDPDALARRFAFDLTDTRGPSAELAEEVPSLPSPPRSTEGALEQLDRALPALVQPLSRGDLWAWVGLETRPPELELGRWPGVASALVEALRRGVVFLYLHAGPRAPASADDSHGDPTAPFYPHGPPFDSADWTAPLATLARNVVEELKCVGASPEQASRSTRLGLLAATLGPTFYLSPGCLYGSIRRGDRALGRYVHTGIRADASDRGVRNLDDADAEVLQRFVAEAVDLHLPERREIAFRIHPPSLEEPRETGHISLVPGGRPEV